MTNAARSAFRPGPAVDRFTPVNDNAPGPSPLWRAAHFAASLLAVAGCVGLVITLLARL